MGCLSPYTLKYLNATVSKPNKSVYILHNFSPVTLVTEYGFKQSSGIFSFRGILFFKPYPEDVELYITLFTLASLAHCKIVHVPTTLVLADSMGFLIVGCILASAAK